MLIKSPAPCQLVWAGQGIRSDWRPKEASKHILLPYAVNALTNNVELIQILNRCGHGLAYSQIEEFNTALCIQKKAMTPENAFPFPDNIKPHISTSLAWNNIDRLEETLSGGGTSHRVNGIAINTSSTNVFERYGSRICKCLHWMWWCRRIFWKRKTDGVKLGKRRPAYQELFQQLGVEWELSDELFVRLQEFTYLMYSSNPGTKDVNVLRYRLFCARKGELESHQLPPCQDTLRKWESKLSVSNMAQESSKFTPNPLAHWLWMVSKGW